MANLRELLERVKAATGPDTLLDLHLCDAFGLLTYGATARGYTRFPHPALTASLDAALALVERCGWRLRSLDNSAPAQPSVMLQSAE